MMLRFLRDAALAAIAGLAMWSAFPDVSWWWMTLPALALLFALVDHASTLRALTLTLIFAISWWLPLISWVPLATGGVLPWFALTATQVLWLLAWVLCTRIACVWAWAATWWGQALIYALTWVGVEQARSHYPWSGFPWGGIAIPQVDSPLGRLAPLGGEVLVSFVVVIVAILIRRAFSLHMDEDTQHFWQRPGLILIAVGIICVSWVLPVDAYQEEGALRVGVVQGGVELPGAQTFAVEGKVTGNHARVTSDLAKNADEVDLVVWGETAADRDPEQSPLVAGLLQSAAESASAPILFGFANESDGYRWNWLGMWYAASGQDLTQLYAKQTPVPFGEFIPWRSFVSALATQVAQVNIDMAAGQAPGIMHVRLNDARLLPVAVGICFESAYSEVIGEGVRLGGQVIVVPSNNYHFRDSAQSAQQAQLLRFRALEFSRSAIQVSTTGESVIIRPNGAVLAKTTRMEPQWLVETVPLRSSMTPAALMGDWPAYIVMALTLFGVFLGLLHGISLRRKARLTAPPKQGSSPQKRRHSAKTAPSKKTSSQRKKPTKQSASNKARSPQRKKS